MACSEAGCALLGGETAEHPGLLGPDEYDLAGAATGVVERDQILGAERVVRRRRGAGHGILGPALQRLLPGQARIPARSGWTLDRYVPELGQTLGEELLTPTRIYARDCLALIEAVEVHAMSHITGGGLANNLARVIPPHCEARIDRTTWQPPPIFGLIQQLGEISDPDLAATFNMGVGMVAVLPSDVVDEAVRLLPGVGCGPGCADRLRLPARSNDKRVSLFGQHVVG